MTERLEAAGQERDLRVVFQRAIHFQPDTNLGTNCLTLQSQELTPSWIQATGLQAPTLIQADLQYHDQLRDAVPTKGSSFDLARLPELLDAGQQAPRVGRRGVQDREVITLDVSRQAPGPRWTVRQWCLYWRDRQVAPFTEILTNQSLAMRAGESARQGPAGQSHMQQRQASDVVAHISAGGSDDDGKANQGLGEEEDEADSAFVHQGAVDQFADQSAPRKGIRDVTKRRLISMTCLCIADTALGKNMPPPLTLQALDVFRVLNLMPTQFPNRHYLACYPEGAAVNFSINPTGATAWCHVLMGKLVLLLVPPSVHNLSVYATWSQHGLKPLGLLLADACQGVIRMEVEAGQSIIIPGGWPYCIAAVQDTLLLGAQFLHLHNLRLQFASWELEELRRVKPWDRYPSFKHAMWHAALHFARGLRAVSGLPKLQKQRVTTSRDQGGNHVPAPTFSYSQAFPHRQASRRPVTGNATVTHTDSANGWAAPSVEEGDHAMSARKKRARDELETIGHQDGEDVPQQTQRHGSRPAAKHELLIPDGETSDAEHGTNLEFKLNAATTPQFKRLRGNATRDVSQQPASPMQPFQTHTMQPVHEPGTIIGPDGEKMDIHHHASPPHSYASEGREPVQQVHKQPSSDMDMVLSGTGAAPAPVQRQAPKIKLKLKTGAVPTQSPSPTAPVVKSIPQQQPLPQPGADIPVRKGVAVRMKSTRPSHFPVSAHAPEPQHVQQSSSHASKRHARQKGRTGRPARARKPSKRYAEFEYSDEDVGGMGQTGQQAASEVSGMGSDAHDTSASAGLPHPNEDDFASMSTSDEEASRGTGEGPAHDATHEPVARPRRTHRRVAAPIADTVDDMLRGAMARREAEAQEWDVLKERSTRRRATNRQEASATLGSDQQFKAVLQARQATAKAKDWSDDDDGSPEPPMKPTLKRIHDVQTGSGLRRMQGRRQTSRISSDDVDDDDSDDNDQESSASADAASNDVGSGFMPGPVVNAAARQGQRFYGHHIQAQGSDEESSEGLGNAPRSKAVRTGQHSNAIAQQAPDLPVKQNDEQRRKLPLKIKLKTGHGIATHQHTPNNNIPQSDGAGDFPDDDTFVLLPEEWQAQTQVTGTNAQQPAQQQAAGQSYVGQQDTSSMYLQPIQAPVTQDHSSHEGMTQPFSVQYAFQALANPHSKSIAEQPRGPVASPAANRVSQDTSSACMYVQQHQHSTPPPGQHSAQQQAASPTIGIKPHGVMHQAPELQNLSQHPLPGSNNLQADESEGRRVGLHPTASQILMPPPPAKRPRLNESLPVVTENDEDHPQEGEDESHEATSAPIHNMHDMHHERAASNIKAHPVDQHRDKQQGVPLEAKPCEIKALEAEQDHHADEQQAQGQEDRQQLQHQPPPARHEAAHKPTARAAPLKKLSDVAPAADKVGTLVALGGGHRVKAAPALKGSLSRKTQLGSALGSMPASKADAGPQTTANANDVVATSPRKGILPVGAPYSTVASSDHTIPQAGAPTGLATLPDSVALHEKLFQTPATAARHRSSFEKAIQGIQAIQLPGIETPNAEANLLQTPGMPTEPSTCQTTRRHSFAERNAQEPSSVLALVPVSTRSKPADNLHSLGQAAQGAGITAAVSATTPHASTSTGFTLSPWELRDLPTLIATLRHWQTEQSYHDELPFTLKDPGLLLDQLEEALGLYCSSAGVQAVMASMQQPTVPLQMLPSLLTSCTSAEHSMDHGVGSVVMRHNNKAAAAVVVNVVTAGNTNTSTAGQPNQTSNKGLQNAIPVCQQDQWQPSSTDHMLSVKQDTHQLTSRQNSLPLMAREFHTEGSMQLSGPDMLAVYKSLYAPGLDMSRPQVGLAALQSLPSAWQTVLQNTTCQNLVGTSPCPSSVLVDMGNNDLEEMVEENDMTMGEIAAENGAVGIASASCKLGRTGATTGTTAEGSNAGPGTTALGLMAGQRARTAGRGAGCTLPGPAAPANASKKMAKLKKNLGLRG